uniref:Uncharacterized protein n=1 Tax=Anguilla anguilla TaxID=7936 RepID=A0A0E9WP96_ANGAN
MSDSPPVFSKMSQQKEPYRPKNINPMLNFI